MRPAVSLVAAAAVVAIGVGIWFLAAAHDGTDLLGTQGIPPGVEIAQIDYVHGAGGVVLQAEEGPTSEPTPEIGPVETYTLRSVDHPDLVRRVVHALRHTQAVRPRAWVMEGYVIVLTAEDSRRAHISVARADAGKKKTAYLQSGEYRSDELERILSEVEHRGIGFSMRKWRYKPMDDGN